MAKKTRTFKKKAVIKAIGKYHRVTLGRSILLECSTNGVALNGGGAGYNLSQLLTGTSTFQQLGKEFALCKIRGISIEVSPWRAGNNDGAIMMALVQAEEENNTGAISSQPNAFSISPQQITRKYIKIGGQFEPTNAQSTLGNLKLAWQVLQTFGTSYTFTVLLKLYVTFKSNI